MAWRLLTIAVVGFMLAADAPQERVKQSLKDLQGTWLLVGREANGQEVRFPAPAVGDVRLIVRGSRTVTFAGCSKTEGSIHVYRGSNRLELREWTGKDYQGRYTLDGDELRMCMMPTGECPESMDTKSGNTSLFIYRRQKPDDPDMGPAQAKLKKLQGAWRMKLKKEADEGSPRDLIWTFQGDELSVEMDGKPLPDKGTVVLNPKTQPPVLGVLFPGNMLVGTYSLDDDVLTISCNQPGAPQRIIVLKRAAP